MRGKSLHQFGLSPSEEKGAAIKRRSLSTWEKESSERTRKGSRCNHLLLTPGWPKKGESVVYVQGGKKEEKKGMMASWEMVGQQRSSCPKGKWEGET